MLNKLGLNNPRLKPLSYFAVGVLAIIALNKAHALPNDSQQPIVIKSNSAIRDDKLGVTVYSGNVNMEQGSMRIKAEKVTLSVDNNKVTKIVAVGNEAARASFKQQPEPDAGDIEAYAQTIEYQIIDDTITLLDNASLKQPDGSTISSNKITYDVNAARVEAGGQNGQVETIITPQNSFE